MRHGVAGGRNREAPFIVVSHLSASGNKVVLERDGGEIVHEKSGRRIRIHRKGGVYVVRMWVAAAPAAEEQGTKGASGFPRPGAL